MGDELAGAADIATGAVIARAVEPKAGEAGASKNGAGHFHESACLNCDTMLVGTYCHACGQQGHLHRTLGAFWHDLAHGVLHFEGKIWRTLPMLFWKPGELTRRYVHGERARFVSPLALFLFAAFLMFATLSAMGSHLEAPADLQANVGEQMSGKVSKSTGEMKKELADMDARIAAAQAKGENVAELKSDRADLASVLRMVEGGPKILGQDKGKLISNFKTGLPRLDEGIQKANENPNLLLYKLQSNAYKYSWMLIPISVPFVWLMFFWRRQFKLYDHAIFVTYSLSFLTLLITVVTIAGNFGLGIAVIVPVMLIIPPLHMYRQLKGAYGISRFGALIRTFLLLIAGLVVTILFVTMLLTLGLMG